MKVWDLQPRVAANTLQTVDETPVVPQDSLRRTRQEDEEVGRKTLKCESSHERNKEKHTISGGKLL